MSAMTTARGVADRGYRFRRGGCDARRASCAALLALAGAVWSCGDDDDPTVVPALTVDAGGGSGSSPDASSSGSGGSGGSGSALAGSDAGGAGAEPTSCTPGEVRACLFDRLCSGEQACNAEGTAFGPCECGRAPGVVGVIGAACDSDASCGSGGVCFAATGNQYAGAGGPAKGYCTAACEDNADCSARDPLSRCVGGLGPGGASYCIRTCESKEPAPGEAKCLNRPEVMCLSIAADGVAGFEPGPQQGVCVPRCGSDTDCPAGRFCHAEFGVCRNAPALGAPVGARCTLESNCDGNSCLDRDENGVGTCSADCTLGSLSGCGFARDAAVREAACVVPFLSGGGFSEGPGDKGVCQELCDVAADCQRAEEGAVCVPLTESAAAFFGRTGVCATPD